MSTSDFLTIIAIILAPVLAVQVQKWIERYREKQERKVGVFRTLMATRGTPLAPPHVEALNMIDIEFKENKSVVDAWELYVAHLNTRFAENGDPDHQQRLAQWSDKGNDLLIDLLHEMSKTLGYNFNKALLKKQAYTPMGHVEYEQEQKLLRLGLVNLINSLWEGHPIPVKLFKNGVTTRHAEVVDGEDHTDRQ